MHIFVYGTLREGDTRNSAIVGTQRLPGQWTVKGTLHSLRAFPALILDDESNNQVIGEVYFVPDNLVNHTIRTLDAIEGVAFGLYRRVRTIATSEDGETIECEVYVAGRDILDRIDEYPVIVSGDWFNQTPLPSGI